MGGQNVQSLPSTCPLSGEEPTIGMLPDVSALAKRVLPKRAIARIEPLVSALPDRIGARLNPAKYAGMPAGPTEPLVIGAGRSRLVIGPVNTAGQAYQWARAVDAQADRAAISLIVEAPNSFGFAAHRGVPRLRAEGSSDWQRAEFQALVAQATHVLIESGHPLFGPLFRRDIVREVRALQSNGIKVAIVAHGSDVRDVRAHSARESHSPFSVANLVPKAADLDASAFRVRAALARLGVPLFGSTPSVQFDLPTATWLPVVIDPEAWVSDSTVLTRAVPVVLHAPSSAELKGSEVADTVLTQLQERGLIEYHRITGLASSEMRDAYATSDIVVDSLRMGGYGVAACEAMAAGRLVLSYVNKFSRATVEAQFGEPPPIWSADAKSLESSMIEVLAHREQGRAMARRGPGFVRAGHDGRASIAALQPFLDS